MSRLTRLGALFAIFAAVMAFAPTASAAFSCGGQSHQNSCGNGTNIYPCCPNGGNCTWWAWENMCRNWHLSLPNWGNANTWAAHARLDPRFDVLGQPAVPSVGTSTPRSGHVAWVLGAGGGRVTVTEENCCVGCGGGVRQISYPVSKFNSGYVALHGASSCDCSPGQTQTEACSCGSHTRSCGADCKWDGYDACKGPPEVCDGIDNDCNGLIDDGEPKELGANRPDYAATLLDSSSPRALAVGEHATAWGDFRNDGNVVWKKGQIWLAAKGDADAGVSGLFSQGQWPAWNVAATLDHDVAPGEVARFTFDVTSDANVSAKLDDSFTLQVAGGADIACPAPELSTTIWVGPGAEQNADADGGPEGSAASDSPSTSSGCSAAPGSDGTPGATFVFAATLFAWRSRRRSSKRQVRP